MNTDMPDSSNPLKPEIPAPGSEAGGQTPVVTPEVGGQRPEVGGQTTDIGSAMAAPPASPQPPKLDVGAIGTVEELSPEEYLALLTHEKIIGDEFKNSIDVGLALIEIRDRRLYRREHSGFGEYYQMKWRFDKKKVYFLTATAEVHKSITTATNLASPDFAFQMRPLFGLATEEVRLAWEHAAKMARGGKITERLVRGAVVELEFKPEGNEEGMKERRERAERRQQLTRAMADLLELIVMRKPYEELEQKASLLDQQMRFFFPKRPERG